MSKTIIWVAGIVLLITSSCTPHREIVYFQDKQDIGDTVSYDTSYYKIKPDDILHVRVLTIEEENYRMFNTDDNFRTARGDRSDITVYIEGYSVNEYGYIKMPVLGNVKVEGMTINEATDHIQEKIDDYLIDATVVVKLVNFNVTVLGEVSRPGNYYVYDNRLTIVDALGLAGDMTDFGKRNVNIVRHTPDGAKFATLDLTDRKSFSSEFFYLQSNDIVYVEPTIAKRLGFKDFPFSVLFSAISTTVLLLNFIN